MPFKEGARDGSTHSQNHTYRGLDAILVGYNDCGKGSLTHQCVSKLCTLHWASTTTPPKPVQPFLYHLPICFSLAHPCRAPLTFLFAHTPSFTHQT